MDRWIEKLHMPMEIWETVIESVVISYLSNEILFHLIGDEVGITEYMDEIKMCCCNRLTRRIRKRENSKKNAAL